MTVQISKTDKENLVKIEAGGRDEAILQPLGTSHTNKSLLFFFFSHTNNNRSLLSFLFFFLRKVVGWLVVLGLTAL